MQLIKGSRDFIQYITIYQSIIVNTDVTVMCLLIATT